ADAGGLVRVKKKGVRNLFFAKKRFLTPFSEAPASARAAEEIMETSVSLLERLRSSPDEATWRRLDDLYRPLILRWLRRDPKVGAEAEDIVQEVMQVLLRELP